MTISIGPFISIRNSSPLSLLFCQCVVRPFIFKRTWPERSFSFLPKEMPMASSRLLKTVDDDEIVNYERNNVSKM